MILDTSAVLAVLFREPGYEDLILKMTSAESLGIGAPTLAECGMVLSAKHPKNGILVLDEFILEGTITVIAFSREHQKEAVRAYLQYGKGRHRAALNFGDCMSYAVAKISNQELLFVGREFAKTDLAIGAKSPRVG